MNIEEILADQIYPGRMEEFEVHAQAVGALTLGSLIAWLREQQIRYSQNGICQPIDARESKEIGQHIYGDLYIEVPSGEDLPWQESKFLWAGLVDADPIPVSFATHSSIPATSKRITDTIERVIRNSPVQFRRIQGVLDGKNVDSHIKTRDWEFDGLVKGDDITVDELLLLRRKLNIATFYLREDIRYPLALLEMLRLGGVGEFIGMQESNILEVKSSAYEMQGKDKNLWKFELVQDVARFANSESGGLLVVGMHTKRLGGSDTINKITPIPVSKSRANSYLQIIDARLHPPVDDLEIQVIEHDGGHLLCIYIPPQGDEIKPFLVQGGLVGGRYEGGMISIMRRRGEDSIPVTAREIHSMLVAGRAFLRGDNRP